MSVSEVITFGIPKQMLNQKAALTEGDVPLETDLSLQMINERDIVTLDSTNEQGLSQSNNDGRFKDEQTVQEISLVAQAASTFSQIIGGGLNEDELAAIRKLAVKIEPIAKDILSGDPKEFNIEEAIDAVLPGSAQGEIEASEFDVENIRQLPKLVSAAIDAGFEKQFQALNETSKELIVSSMSELMRFFRQKIIQVLEPLRYASSLVQSESQVPVKVDLTAQS